MSYHMLMSNVQAFTTEHTLPACNFQQLQSKLTIDLGQRSYAIHIGGNILENIVSLGQLPQAKTALIVSNTTVAPLYAQTLKSALSAKFEKVLVVELPDGEEYKNWQTLNQIYDALLSNQCDRKTVLFALGGGVVGDITGFAAASYMRGVPFVQIPTSLLAQVDSSVGGKTGINHPLGKNMIGAFYQPRMVLCDTAVLSTLPERELSAGLAEVIKYGPIADYDFFTWLEQSLPALLARNTQALHMAIQRSCQIKAWVVAQDEKESGMRAILNFGHTFAHAIEAGLGYGKWLHGEAVACGMVMASLLSAKLGLIDNSFVNRLTKILQQANLPTTAPALHKDKEKNIQSWLGYMRVDKKAQDGKVRFIVLNKIGSAAITTATDDVITEVINSCSSN